MLFLDLSLHASLSKPCWKWPVLLQNAGRFESEALGGLLKIPLLLLLFQTCVVHKPECWVNVLFLVTAAVYFMSGSQNMHIAGLNKFVVSFVIVVLPSPLHPPSKTTTRTVRYFRPWAWKKCNLWMWSVWSIDDCKHWITGQFEQKFEW